MLSDEAKKIVDELVLIEGANVENLTVAVFLNFCCDGATQTEKLKSAAEELNQRFSTGYKHNKIREWMHQTQRGEGRAATCPERIEKYMASRLMLQLVPSQNDQSTVNFMKLLNIPYAAAEIVVEQQQRLHSDVL